MTDMPDSDNHGAFAQAAKALAKIRSINKRGAALAQQRAEFIRGLPLAVREVLAVCGFVSYEEANLQVEKVST